MQTELISKITNEKKGKALFVNGGHICEYFLIDLLDLQ